MSLPNKLFKEMYNQNKTEILLSLGSNIGDSQSNIINSVKLFRETGIISDISFSSFYITEPVGYELQEHFINAALTGFTGCTAGELMYLIKSVEYLIGRKKRKRWHEREIDIDIIIFGDEIINTEYLTIPHKEMTRRLFVLVPSNEITPNMQHPVLKKSINQLLRSYIRSYNGIDKVIRQ